eukprot:Skav218797  [mRNA]  locus=scaffold1140:212667:215312:- [translate_table: standard]
MVASDENRNDKLAWSSIAFLGLSTVIVVAAIYFAGPKYLFQTALKLLPSHPGWNWVFGWALLVCLIAVVASPIWSAVSVLTGLMFGLHLGTAINFSALYIAVVVSTFLGMTVLQEPIRRWLDSGSFPLAQRAFRSLEEAHDSFQFLVLFRFLLMPIWMRNYAPATLRVPMWKLLLSALPHTLWVSFILASLGTSLQDLEDVFTQDSQFKLSNIKWQDFAVFIVACLATVCVSLYSYKKYNELMNDESAPLLRSKDP